MKKSEIIVFIIGCILGILLSIYLYKRKLQQQVMKGYGIDYNQVKDKSISDLKAMLKALENKK